MVNRQETFHFVLTIKNVKFLILFLAKSMTKIPLNPLKTNDPMLNLLKRSSI